VRKLIVGLIIGVVLTETATATAHSGGWIRLATDVKCKGGKSVICYSDSDANLNGTSYSVFISECSVAVWRDFPNGKSQKILDRWQGACR